MRWAILLVLPLLALTFYADQNLTIDKQRFNTTVAGNHDSLIMTGEYYTLLVREGDCKTEDIYTFCVDEIDYDVVEYWPSEHRVNLTWIKQCPTCSPYGAKCVDRMDCSSACVHGVCRPRTPWCGDGYCDAKEVCSVDCDDWTPPRAESSVNVSLPNVSTNASGPRVTINTSVDGSLLEQPQGGLDAAAPSASQADDSLSAPIGDSPNWLGGVLTLIVGIVGLVWIFARKRRPKDPMASL